MVKFLVYLDRYDFIMLKAKVSLLSILHARHICEPAIVALSDGRPIAGSITPGSGNILSLRLIMKYFRWSFCLFC